MLNNESTYDYKLNGNPKGASPKISQRNGNKMKMKVKKIQANSPPNVHQIIANISQELTLLNYKNYPITTKEQFQRRCTFYFRSHVNKRIIGGYVTLFTFKNKWITQKEVIDRFPHLKKAFVSLVFKHCVLEGWFIAKRLSPKISCYQVCDMMLNSAKDYYNFCSTSRKEYEFIY